VAKIGGKLKEKVAMKWGQSATICGKYGKTQEETEKSSGSQGKIGAKKGAE
jgi:hypothetical protein